MQRLLMSLAVALFVWSLGIAQGDAATNWPQFHMDVQRYGCNPLETTLNPANVTRLRNRWVGLMGDFVDFSSPAVANGIVYIGSVDVKVYAIKAIGCPGGTRLALWWGGYRSR